MRDLKMSHTAFFLPLLSYFLALHPLCLLPFLPFPCPVLPPPSVCNQSPGNGRAAKIQFASALLRLKNQEDLFFFQWREWREREKREGGWLEGVERKRRKCSSSSVACCNGVRIGRRGGRKERERELQVKDFQLLDVSCYKLNSYTLVKQMF